MKKDYRELTDEQVHQWCRVKHEYWTHDRTRLNKARRRLRQAISEVREALQDLWVARRMYKRSLREFLEIGKEFRKRERKNI